MRAFVFILALISITCTRAQHLEYVIANVEIINVNKLESFTIYKLSSSLLSTGLFEKTNLIKFNDLESREFDLVKFNSTIQGRLDAERPFIGFVLFDSCGDSKFGDPVYGSPVMSSKELELEQFRRRLSPDANYWYLDR